MKWIFLKTFLHGGFGVEKFDRKTLRKKRGIFVETVHIWYLKYLQIYLSDKMLSKCHEEKKRVQSKNLAKHSTINWQFHFDQNCPFIFIVWS
jgi:hypothetical protein